MKVSGILMSGDLPDKAHAGIKTETRRILNPQPWYGSRVPGGAHFIFPPGSGQRFNADDGPHGFLKMEERFQYEFAKDCPFGRTGDLLYVRETYFHHGKWQIKGTTKNGRISYEFIPEDEVVLFHDKIKLLNETFTLDVYTGERTVLPHWYKRLGRFMPRKYARTYLEIRETRIERVQEITEEGAIAEGVDYYVNERGVLQYKDYDSGLFILETACNSFRSLWIKIHGETSWSSNDWVRVIKYKKVNKPTDG